MSGTPALWLCACIAIAFAHSSEGIGYGQRERSAHYPAQIALHPVTRASTFTPRRTQCLVNGLTLHDGAVWSTHPCSKCRCHRGTASCRPISCDDTASRNKQPPKGENQDKKDMEARRMNDKTAATGLGAKETNDRKPETVMKKVVSKVVPRPVTTHWKQQGAGAVMDVRGVRKSGGILGHTGVTSTQIRKFKAKKSRLLSGEEEDEDDDESNSKDDDDEDDDEELAIGTLAAFRPALPSLHRSGVTQSLPAKCLLAHSFITCGNAGLTHMPVIKDLGVKTLYLAENKIRKIPPWALAGLPNLEWLDLSKNKLDDSSLSPDLFRNLTKLKRLHLDGNNFTKIPLLPPSVEELKINDNKINVLTPNSFKGLSKLLTLELEDNELHDGNVSPLAFLPLRKLIYLRLEDNKFRGMPSGLPLTLRELHLSENKIEEIREGVLNKTVHLKVLDLSRNRIREDRIAPRAWIHLREMEALDLSHNKLVHVPGFLPLALRQLSLHHNHIERIPGYVFGHLRPGLESLRLSHNRLGDEGVHVVSFVGLQSSLAELLLDHNQLRSVPRGLVQLKALEVLRLDHNFIRNIPLNYICDTRISDDSSLLSVHLENNLIDRRLIPPTAFSCLKNYHSARLWPQRHDNQH